MRIVSSARRRATPNFVEVINCPLSVGVLAVIAPGPLTLPTVCDLID